MTEKNKTLEENLCIARKRERYLEDLFEGSVTSPLKTSTPIKKRKKEQPDLDLQFEEIQRSPLTKLNLELKSDSFGSSEERQMHDIALHKNEKLPSTEAWTPTKSWNKKVSASSLRRKRGFKSHTVAHYTSTTPESGADPTKHTSNEKDYSWLRI